MGLLDIFKKKQEEPDYDVTNLSVEDLAMGFILDYDMSTWRVKEEYEYDWGSDNFSKEYLLDDGVKSINLEVENQGDISILATEKIKIRDLGSDIIDRTIENKTPPKELIYDGVRYYLDSDCAGYFNDKTKKSKEWQELISWQYYDDEEEKVIGITQWGEREFEAVAGKVVQLFEISNIIPASR